MDMANVTQVQLANKTGFTQSYISRILNGRYSDLPGETMRTLADSFGCAMEDLFPSPDASNLHATQPNDVNSVALLNEVEQPRRAQ